ncbi:MAG: hypothetical protein QM680_13980 [Luteolibacter sp.]
MNCPNCNTFLAAQWTRCGICGHQKEALPPVDGSVFEPTLPDSFGYYWVTKKQGAKPVMLHLCPGQQYRNDQRSVEAWDCPGIGRSRLDWLNMPRWKWERVPEPNQKILP